ncbi:MAG: GumC family protein [Acidobacteriaceae bacterium]
MNEETIEPTKDLGDYLEVLRRRRKAILLIIAVLSIVSVVVAFVIPPVYRSTATILIEEQEIPKDLIRSTITAYAWQRIKVISQQVMTRANLLNLIKQYDLYPNKRRSEPTEDLIKDMRHDIKLKPITAKVIDPATGQPREAIIAFKLSYDSDKPAVAQEVDNELTSLYLNENLKTRTAQATNTYDFLTGEAQKLQTHINNLEAKIAAFKEKYAASLPELQQLNLQLMDRTETELMEANDRMQSLEDRKTYLEGQLDQINPNLPAIGPDGTSMLDPASRLQLLETQYATERAKYYPDYPDVVRLKREIANLKKQVGAVSDTAAEEKEATRLRTKLAAERQKYSDDYPDVVKLKAELAALEAQIKKNADQPALPAMKPQNPAYITLSAELQGIKSNITAETMVHDQLRTKIAGFEKDLTKTPQVQRKYRDLKRDYENSQREFLKLKSKQMDARIGEQMEKDQEGERLSMIDPPDLPQKPVEPNRLAVIILGLVLSVGGGLGYAAVAESMDKSVHGARALSTVMGAAPLSVIPYIENSADLEQHAKSRRFAVGSGVAVLIVAVLLVQFFWIPWDVLWFKGMRLLSGFMHG